MSDGQSSMKAVEIHGIEIKRENQSPANEENSEIKNSSLLSARVAGRLRGLKWERGGGGWGVGRGYSILQIIMHITNVKRYYHLPLPTGLGFDVLSLQYLINV